MTPEGFGYDPERGELWFAGETAEALLLELQARRRSLASELDELRARLDTPIPDAAYSLERNPFADAVSSSAERLLHALDVSVEHLEAPLRTEVDAGAAAAASSAPSCAGSARPRSSCGRSSRPPPRPSRRSRSRRRGSRRRPTKRAADFEQADADEPAEGDDREQLAATVERLERRRETLGQVNPLAHEEYEAEKERLEELAAQRADLEASLAELEKLRNELTETVERRFAETFDAVRATSQT